MMTPEVAQVLASLRRHPLTSVEALARSCGQATVSITRVLSQLEWTGSVVVYRDRAGSCTGVQLNDQLLRRTIH
jgi:DNA-binding MarR family transcriptional regulator